jgi:hypothetical protein
LAIFIIQIFLISDNQNIRRDSLAVSFKKISHRHISSQPPTVQSKKQMAPGAKSPQLIANTEPSTSLMNYASPDDVDLAAQAESIPELPLPSDSATPIGNLRLRIYINENGLIDNIETELSTLTPSYTELLINTFRQGIFQPARKDNQTIRSWQVIEIILEEQTHQ